MRGILCVAWKECLHLWRDKRLLAVVLILPPLITLLLGNAFEVTDLKNVPCLLDDRDQSAESRAFAGKLQKDDSFAWRQARAPDDIPRTLTARNLLGVVIIPPGWGASLKTKQPDAIKLYLDGADTTTAPFLQGQIEKNLGDFQSEEVEGLVGSLSPDSLKVLASLPEETRDRMKGQSIRWTAEETTAFNPNLKFIEYVVPGIIGLVLQLVTVTLISCAITHERETGSFSQLSLTPLRYSEIICGKIIPYFWLSLFLILEVSLTASAGFGIAYHNWPLLILNGVLFILFSLGFGLFISCIARTQTQAMQLSIFLLLPILILSGAFGPISQLPPFIQVIANLFPLAHFCRAFRLINLYHADFTLVSGDLFALLIGAIVMIFASVLFISGSSRLAAIISKFGKFRGAN